MEVRFGLMPEQLRPTLLVCTHAAVVVTHKHRHGSGGLSESGQQCIGLLVAGVSCKC